MTPHADETNRLLAEILLAIQGLNRSLKTHETRIGHLENVQMTKEDLEPPGSENAERISTESEVPPVHWLHPEHILRRITGR